MPDDPRSPTRRFSNRVDAYVRGRPDYPAPFIRALCRDTLGLPAGAPVVDLGAGTGILSRRLLDADLQVTAVEPNAEMRAAAQVALGQRAGFRWAADTATAEHTGLPAASAALVTAGQAFHWFEVDATRRECRRILEPAGAVLLLWNERPPVAAAPFQGSYEAFLHTWGVDYTTVVASHHHVGRLQAFFGGGGWTEHHHDHVHQLDHAGLVARVCSSSYLPAPGHPRYPAMRAAIDTLFRDHAVSGTVGLHYRVRAYVGLPAPSAAAASAG